MGIVQSDVLIRTAVEHTIEEMKKNPWLIDDALSDLIEDPLLSEIYGQKEIDNAKEWLRNNKIDILLKHRMDSQSTPCVTISLGESNEADNEATLADLSTEVVTLEPSQINKPIPYIIKPFTPLSYDQDTGVFKFSSDIDMSLISVGMLVLDPSTSTAYPIIEKFVDGVGIEPASVNITQIAIIPQYRIWKARRERAGFRESYTIGCHVSGDPSSLLWLHTIVLYGLLRYRESLFEARNFQISSIRSSDLMRNNQFDIGADNIYSRWITISGLVENSWIKSPKRVIEVARVKDPESVPDTGIKIMSNLDSVIEVVDQEKDDIWVTKKVTQKTKKKVYKRD